MGNEGKRALVYLFSFVFHPSLPYILLGTQGGDGGDGGNGGTGGNGGNIYLYSNDSRLFVCIFLQLFPWKSLFTPSIRCLSVSRTYREYLEREDTLAVVDLVAKEVFFCVFWFFLDVREKLNFPKIRKRRVRGYWWTSRTGLAR